MASFPELASGAPIIRHPVNVSRVFNVRVHTFLSDKEQRYIVSKGHGLVLEYRGVSGYDLQRVMDFFYDQRGARATAPLNSAMTNYFDITIDGTQYNYCCFEQDAIQYTEELPGKYSFTVSIRQLRENS